jgi:CDP-glycerol glycerophosphotransferase (TagB/SpsB family)
MMFDDEILQATFCGTNVTCTQYSSVTTQFALMMEPLRMYDPEYNTET